MFETWHLVLNGHKYSTIWTSGNDLQWWRLYISYRTDVGEAGFRWCWVSPIFPRWQEEGQAQSFTTVSQDSPSQPCFSPFPMERAGRTQVRPEVLPLGSWILLSFRKALSQVCAIPGHKVKDGLKYTNNFVIWFRKPLLIWCTLWNNLESTLLNIASMACELVRQTVSNFLKPISLGYD